MDNSLKFTITSSADTKGFSEVDKALSELERQAAIANQRLVEASKNDKVRESTLMSLQSAVWDYDKKLQDASNTEEKASTSSRGLTTSIIAGSAAYDIAKRGLSDVKNYMESSVTSANKYQSAIIGLSSVAQKLGVDQDAAKNAAQSLAKDGLMSVTDAAEALKNLLRTNFNLDQAIAIINRFKDTAAFGRQASLGFGQSIVSATEGIKNQNEILLDNAGMSTNATKLIQRMGGSLQDFSNIASDATTRERFLNGMMQDTAAQAGDAAKYINTYAGQQAAASAQTEKMKQVVGELYQAMTGGLLQAFTSAIGNNQQMIVSVGAGTVAAVGLGVAFLGLSKAIQAFSMESLMAAATNPLVALFTTLSVLAGAVVFEAVDKMQGKIKEANSELGKTSGALGSQLPQATNQTTAAMQKLQDKLGDIDDQIAKADRDFAQSMADMVQNHLDKVNQLNDQIQQENATYEKAIAQKTSTFQKSQETELDAHEKRVQKIQKQIDNETALGKWANQQTLKDLQDKLNEENASYDQSNADKKATYEQDVQNTKDSHNQKLADLQKQMDEENAFLAKHNAEVAAYRNANRLDEMQKLEQSHQDQLVAFAKQKDDAIKNAKQTADGVGGVWNSANAGLQSQLSSMGDAMGKSMGNAFKQAIKDSLVDVGKGIGNFFGKATAFVAKGFDPRKDESLSKLWQDASNDPAWKFRAAGGPVQPGQAYWVGDNPDGTLNATSELFVPNTAGTIIPAKQAQQLAGGGAQQQSGVTIHQTNHIYTQFDMGAAAAELGWKLSMRAA